MIKAFSLIELMVVIAIVALLAAIAVPAYHGYTARTRAMATISPTLDVLKQEVTNYYSTRGTFPTAAELGYTTSPDPMTISNPSTVFGSDVAYVAVGEMPSSCNATWSLIGVGMNGAELNLNPGANMLAVTIILYEDPDSGIVRSICYEADEITPDPSGTPLYGYYCSEDAPTVYSGINAYIDNIVCP